MSGHGLNVPAVRSTGYKGAYRMAQFWSGLTNERNLDNEETDFDFRSRS